LRGAKPIIIEVTPERRPASQTGNTCPAISKCDDDSFVRQVWVDLTGAQPAQPELQEFIADKNEKKRDRLVNRLLRTSTVQTKSCTACHAPVANDLVRYFDLVGRAHDGLRDLTVAQWLTQGQNLSIGSDSAVYMLPRGAVALWNQAADVNAATSTLPDDVSVNISLKGKEPMTIMIRKADRIWEINSADGPEKIPDEWRPLVSSTLTALPGAYSQTFSRFLPANSNVWTPIQALATFAGPKEVTAADALKPQPASEPTQTQTSTAYASLKNLDRQIESMTKQLEELRRSIEELRKLQQPAEGVKQK
jgi:hypothetical protein